MLYLDGKRERQYLYRMVIFVINECRISRVFSGLLSQTRIDFQRVIEYAGHFIVAFLEMLYFSGERGAAVFIPDGNICDK